MSRRHTEQGQVSDDIDVRETYMSNLAVGALSGGNDFGLVGNPATSIKQIIFHLNVDCIGRVEILKHDQTRLVIGAKPVDVPNNTDKRVLTWMFEAGEKLTQLKLYQSVNHDRLAGIHLRTSRDQDLHFSLSNASTTGVDMSVGTGQCVGLFGFAADYIYCMGFAMRRSPPQ